MIMIEYDPSGDHVADTKVMEYAMGLVEKANSNEAIHNVKVSQGLIIDAIRLLVRRGTIPHTSIGFKFNDILIYPDAKGQLDKWPTGFCDTQRDLLWGLVKK